MITTHIRDDQSCSRSALVRFFVADDPIGQALVEGGLLISPEGEAAGGTLAGPPYLWRERCPVMATVMKSVSMQSRTGSPGDQLHLESPW